MIWKPQIQWPLVAPRKKFRNILNPCSLLLIHIIIAFPTLANMGFLLANPWNFFSSPLAGWCSPGEQQLCHPEQQTVTRFTLFPLPTSMISITSSCNWSLCNRHLQLSPCYSKVYGNFLPSWFSAQNFNHAERLQHCNKTWTISGEHVENWQWSSGFSVTAPTENRNAMHSLSRPRH